ncbi:MAG TPA: GNAT family N-acetyltransferase, partial [Thermoanaerobaculia bacterium]|nr:GNAT family N-acetyltransferase [Thermoanaerobaculia bacterium]
RLLLREFTPGDLPAFLAYQADPRYTEFYGPEDLDPGLAAGLIEKFIAWPGASPRRNYQLAIARRETPADIIGSCGVRLEGCEPGVGEFGLELAADHWGRGFASEAARAILQFAFDDLGVREVLGVTVTQNTRVQRLVARLGFRKVETRPGPPWMRARGWSETVWALSRRFEGIKPGAMSSADIQACLEKDFFPALPGLEKAEANAPDLLGRMKGALLRMLAELDDLPRDHLVWRYLAVQTVNATRLSQYTDLKLRASPQDRDALWTSAAMNLASAGSASYEGWQSLLLVEERFDAAWPVYASLVASLAGGGDDADIVEDLSSFLKRNDLSESAAPILKSLEAGEHDYARVLLDDSYRHDDVIHWARRINKLLKQD